MGFRCAVVGDPVAHSLSPVLHTAAYDALGLDGAYTARRVPAGGLADALGPPDVSGEWRGLSVTAPLKREAYLLAGDLDVQARRAGGVNTLVRRPGPPGGAVWHGHNTDVPGAAAALAEHGVAPRAVTILGGGATAASTALAAADLGARRVRLLVRDSSRATEASAAVRAHPGAPEVEVGPLEPARVTGDLVVSTVPAAAQSAALVQACLVGDAGTGGPPVVFEVLYEPWPTPLAAAFAAAGRTVVGGLDLLVHQAALQHRLFTGTEAPLESMRAAGRAALAARGSP